MKVWQKLASYLLFAFVVGGCGGSSSTAGTTQVAEVRVVNGFQDIGSVDLWADQTVVAGAATFGQSTSYLSVLAGQHTLRFKDSMNLGADLVSENLSFAVNSSSTIVGYGIGANRKILVVPDDRSASPVGTVQVRWANALSTQGNVDAYITVPNVSLMGLSPEPLTIDPSNQVSGFTSLTPGTYQIRVFPAGVSLGTPLINTTVTLNDSDRITILLLDPAVAGGAKSALVLSNIQ